MRVSDRMSPITSFIVMDILEEALAMQRKGTDVVHLEVGEPDFAPPPAVVEALKKAAADGKTHYTHSLGAYELREAVAAWYERFYGVKINPERVIITPGTSGAFLNALSVLLDKGEKILFSDPGYPCYPNFARLLGIEPYLAKTTRESGFVLTRDDVENGLKAGVKAVMAASPANPTGSIIPEDTFKWLCSLPVPFVSDEIYHGLNYGAEPDRTALQYCDEAIVINGLSKRMAMTGLRIGWAIVPPELIRPFQKLNQNVFICADSISQAAAVAALTDESCDRYALYMRDAYRERRRTLIDGLVRLGFKIYNKPDGAFYIFADISAFGMDGFDFAKRMLRDAAVAATPGVDFGSGHVRSFARFAYTIDNERIEEGLSRIEKWLGRL